MLHLAVIRIELVSIRERIAFSAREGVQKMIEEFPILWNDYLSIYRDDNGTPPVQ